MKNIKYMVLVLVVLLLPVSVKAEVIQFNVCFGDKGAYSISYNSEENTEVSKNKITSDVIDQEHLTYPEGISENDKKKYQFTAVSLSKNCYVEGDKIFSCPSDKQLADYDIINTYLSDKGVTELISFKFNQTNGTFNVTIKDKYSNQLSVRYVHGSMLSNAEKELNASNFSGQFLSRSSNGYYSISNVAEKTKIILEFYAKSSDKCNGAYIGYISFYTPDSYDYVVSNPALSSEKCIGTDGVLKYKPDGMVNADELNKFNEIKKNYINECYVSTIKYGEITNLLTTIDGKLKKLKEMFSGYGSTNVVGNNICTNNYSVNNKLSYLETGNYWSIKCVESYTANGDTPKLVNAGSGFSYQSNYSVTRTCTIIQINKPTRGTPCTYDINHTCSWPTKTGTGTGQDAGPTEDFDNCVNSCDGGKYTQKCINTCYAKVYDNGRDISFFNKENKYTQFVATYNAPNSSDPCTTDHGRPGYKVCHKGDCACFSTWCGNHGGQCTFYESKTPPGCVDNPDVAYRAALENSKAELDRFTLIQKSIISKENDEYVDYYKYEITDSHLKTKDGKLYVFTVNSKDNPAVSVERVQEDVTEISATTTLGNLDNSSSVNYNSSKTVKASITVNLPLSYVDKVNGVVAYKTSGDSKHAFTINHKLNKLDTINDFNESKYYNQGERKYYTSIWSDDTNVLVINDEVKLVGDEFGIVPNYNIKVISSNLGMAKFGSDIDCYYGVYRDFICDEECPAGEGIQYIYRTIDLEDVFPNNRDPRWNWTGTLNSSTNTATGAASFASKNSLKYNINPIRLTEEIESKGYKIYDVKSDPSEVDYEFVLTSENIRNIRNYNKKVRDYNGDGYNNYADYNMSCYKNSKNKEICTSKFLDNISGNSGSEIDTKFITYSVSGFDMQARKNLAGCNNSKSGACVEIGS